MKNLIRPSGLVVDDESGIRTLVEAILALQNIHILAAHSAMEAWRMIGGLTHSLEFVITDVRLPNEDGIEFAERLRRHNPDLAIILMSGFMTAEQEIRLDPRFEFLRKPFTAVELLDSIRRATTRPANRTKSA